MTNSNRRAKGEQKRLSPSIHWTFYQCDEKNLRAARRSRARSWCARFWGEHMPAPKWTTELHRDGASEGHDRGEEERVVPVSTTLAKD